MAQKNNKNGQKHPSSACSVDAAEKQLKNSVGDNNFGVNGHLFT